MDRRALIAQSEAVRQLELAGVLRFVRSFSAIDGTVRGSMGLMAIVALRADPKWLEGSFWGLHRDVGTNLTDFRSLRGAFGSGSLQIVIDRVTGRFYCDTDRFNPYQDVVGFMGHAFGEVVPHWWRRIW